MNDKEILQKMIKRSGMESILTHLIDIIEDEIEVKHENYLEDLYFDLDYALQDYQNRNKHVD